MVRNAFSGIIPRLVRLSRKQNMAFRHKRGVVQPDVCDSHGWTSLMMAARNGHVKIAEFLLENGADKELRNSSDQTALDIAQFWNQDEMVALLSKKLSSNQNAPLRHVTGNRAPIYFASQNFINRASQLRENDIWLRDAQRQQETKYILFRKTQAVVKPISNNPALTQNSREQYELCVLNYERVKSFMDKEKPVCVFIGVETSSNDNQPLESCQPWFALDVSKMADDTLAVLIPDHQLASFFPEMLQLTNRDASIVSQVYPIMSWIRRYRFCVMCGSALNVTKGGYKLTCSKENCTTNKRVSSTSYPRVDPTVIMGVVSPDGSKLLLGRGLFFPPGMYSCLSGYIEPGESIEDAGKREVFEESGIHVTDIHFDSSQPFPITGSLMLACMGRATNTDIKVDTTEMASVRWFSRQECSQMLKHKHPEGFFVPGSRAIANQLIRNFINQSKL